MTSRTVRILSAAAAAAAIAACAGPAPDAGDKEAVALDMDHLRRIDAVLQKEVDAGVRAGYVAAVVTRDGIAYQTAIGEADPFTDVAMSTDTRFRIASMSKPIVSAAVMQLVERGEVNLSDPVGRYVEGYADARVATSYDRNAEGEFETRPAARPMTVHDLLTHRAGIGYGFSQATDLERAYTETNLFFTEGSLCERIEQIADLPLLFDPGERWEYSYSIDVLGCIIEKASGVSLEAYLKDNLFTPLGMTHTDFFLEPEDLDGLATVIEFNEQGEMVRSGPDALAGASINDTPFTTMSGGAGLLSTVGDYARFMQMMLNYGELDGARVLSRATVELMTSDNTPKSARPERWGNNGITFGIGGAVILNPGYTSEVAAKGDWGWAGYWDTWFTVNPRVGIGYISLAQAQPNPYIKPSDAHFEVKAIAYGAMK